MTVCCLPNFATCLQINIWENFVNTTWMLLIKMSFETPKGYIWVSKTFYWQKQNLVPICHCVALHCPIEGAMTTWTAYFSIHFWLDSLHVLHFTWSQNGDWPNTMEWVRREMSSSQRCTVDHFMFTCRPLGGSAWVFLFWWLIWVSESSGRATTLSALSAQVCSGEELGHACATVSLAGVTRPLGCAGR